MLYQLTQKEPIDHNVEVAFKDIDSDGNGELDREEVLEFLKLYIKF